MRTAQTGLKLIVEADSWKTYEKIYVLPYGFCFFFYFVFWGIGPTGAYIRKDDLTEGFWGAYIWRSLLSEFYGM